MTDAQRTGTPPTTPASPRPAGAVVVLLVLAVLAAAVLSTLVLTRPATVPADAPDTEFSATRAIEHVERISRQPRPIGSPAHADAREYLVEQLSSWGWDVETQQAVGLTDWGEAGTQRLATVSNVVATLPGTDPTGSVVLAAHYDTVAGSPGAGDDGAGVAAVLESARALTQAERPRNDVVALLTDGEEIGLLGAEAFVRERGEQLGNAVVLNFEARGNDGPPMTFRITSPNSGLLDAVAAAPGVLVDSSSEATFESLPNDTDFRHFSDAGLHGLDTALVRGGAYYHSPLDTADRLATTSLQRMGENGLAMARPLASADLAAIEDGDEDLASTLPWGLLRYPEGLDVPLAAGAFLLSLLVVALGRVRREVTVPRVALSAAVAVLAVAVAGAAGYAVWQVALLVDPGQASPLVGNPYRPLPYQVAVLLAATAAVLGVLGLVRRRLGGEAMAADALVVLALVGLALSLTVPGLSMAVVLPTLAVLLAAVLAGVLPRRLLVLRVAVLLAGTLLAAALVGPAVWIGFDIGLDLGGPTSAGLLAVLLLLALPLAAVVWPAPAERCRWRAAVAPATAAVLAVALVAAGLAVNREGETDPRQESVSYTLDADTGEAQWVSWRWPRSEWAHSVLTEAPEELPDVAPWADGSRLASGPAPVEPGLTPPQVEVVTDQTDAGGRKLTLRLSSTRGAPTVGLWVDADSATVQEATVAGREVPLHGRVGPWGLGVQVTGEPDSSVDVRLVLQPHADGVVVRVADRSDDLSDAPDLDPPAGRVLVTPQVWVTRSLTL